MNLQKWRESARQYINKYRKITGYRHVYEITFWLTHRCVYQCPFCVIEKNTGPFIEKELVFATIDEALPYGLEVAPITGGEPMLHPDFAEICNYAAMRVPNVPIHTTGRLIKEKRDLKEMERHGKRWAWWLTLNSHIKEVNDKYRSDSALEDVVIASKLLRERGHLPFIAINVLPESLDHLEETIRFSFEELHTTTITIEPICPAGRAIHNADTVLMTDEQLHTYYEKMTGLIPYWKGKGKAIEAINILYGVPEKCAFLWKLEAFNVHPSGQVNPCCYFLERVDGTGNVHEGVKKVTSLKRGMALEKRMEPSFLDGEERIRKVGMWSCYECLRNYQIHIKGNKELDK